MTGVLQKRLSTFGRPEGLLVLHTKGLRHTDSWINVLIPYSRVAPQKICLYSILPINKPPERLQVKVIRVRGNRREQLNP